ncbi:hypothetical protein L6452_17369 [Arctium lappa]|uniref:Uncharacterized protein n=1 Tax=Arctium lappa TaxID=4217 RepID=A0ACB9C3A2_ARCLA|nr:hypothetical protein L6452_17369 [Arctium lappa]
MRNHQFPRTGGRIDEKSGGGIGSEGNRKRPPATTINAAVRENDYCRHEAATEDEEAILKVSNSRRKVGGNGDVEKNGFEVESGPRSGSNGEEMGLNPKNGNDKLMEQPDDLDPDLEKIKKVGLASGSRPIILENNLENGENSIRNYEGSEQRTEGNVNQPRSISMAEKGKKKKGQGFDKLKIKKGDVGSLGRGKMSFHRL